MAEEETTTTTEESKTEETKTSSSTETPTPKMVPESDLMTVKSQRDDARTKLTLAESEASSWQTKFNDVTAKMGTATTELESLKTIKTDLDELKAKSEGDSKLLTEAAENLVTSKRDIISARYPKLDVKKTEGKSLEQLDIMLDTLEDVAPSGRTKNDPGPGANGSTGAGGISIAMQELADAKAK